LGLDCLEETCPCQPLSPFKGRACERELAKRGIPCYFTTKKSIIKGMVYRGMDLKNRLQAQGHRVIEVYPYATKLRLFPRPIPKKTTRQGLNYLKRHLASLIPNLPQNLDHDLCDALLAAYTGYLHHLGETEPLGHLQEGLIFMPKRAVLTPAQSPKHGIAQLKGKWVRQRANELIAIAHPDFRGELKRAAQGLFWP